MVIVSNSIDNTVGASNSGVTQTFTVQNQSNTANSASLINSTIGGTSAGDCFHRFAVGTANSYAWTLPGTASTSFRLLYAANGTVDTATATNTPMRAEVSGGNGIVIVNSGMAIASGAERSGSAVNLFMVNSNAVANSDVTFNMQTVAGGGFMAHALNGVGYNWIWGNNQPSNQNWQLRSGATADFTTSTLDINVTQAGEVTFPATPAFLAFLGTTVTNATGDGTAYTLGAGTALTEVYDQNADFNTNGTFTAPVTGRYLLTAVIQISDIGVAHTLGFISIVTSNRSYRSIVGSPGIIRSADASLSLMIDTVADMDAADTATVQLTVSNSTLTVDVTGTGTPLVSYFAGNLQC